MTVKYKDTEAPYSHEAPGAVLYHEGIQILVGSIGAPIRCGIWSFK